MKKTIRHACFETNSSSMHSISIAEGCKYNDTIRLNNDGNVELTGGEFGWEVESYTDAITKANYCAVDCFNHESKREMLNSVLREMTGAKEVVWNFSLDSSYIDHQSFGTSNDAFQNEDTLKSFIFCRASVLYTDNDNR